MKLILRQWPPVEVKDVVVDIEDLQGAVVRNYTDSKSQKALRNIHRKYWLLCNCCPEAPAALTVRKMNNSQYCLVNIQGKGSHYKQCPLFYNPSDDNFKPISTTSNKNSFMFTPSPDKNEDISPELIYTVNQTSELEKTLLKMKELLFQESGFNVITANNSYASNLNALEQVVNSELYVNGVKLSKRFYNGYNHFFKAKERLLQELDGDGVKAPIFVVDVVDELIDEGKQLKFTKFYKERKPFAFKLFKSLSSVKYDLSLTGPYFIISQLGVIKDAKGINVVAPVTNIIEPIANKQQWVSVRSKVDRFAVNKLASSISWYKEKLNLDINAMISKGPVSTALGKCNPSFILSLNELKAILDIQLDLTEPMKTQKALQYIIASNIGGGGFCELLTSMSDREINDTLYSAISKLTKELKRASAGGHVFNGQIISLP